jgi:hypothetical protein
MPYNRESQDSLALFLKIANNPALQDAEHNDYEEGTLGHEMEMLQFSVDFDGQEVLLEGCVSPHNFTMPLNVTPVHGPLLACSCGTPECLGLSSIGVCNDGKYVYWHIRVSTIHDPDLIPKLRKIPHEVRWLNSEKIIIYKFHLAHYKKLQKQVFATLYPDKEYPDYTQRMSVDDKMMHFMHEVIGISKERAEARVDYLTTLSAVYLMRDTTRNQKIPVKLTRGGVPIRGEISWYELTKQYAFNFMSKDLPDDEKELWHKVSWLRSLTPSTLKELLLAQGKETQNFLQQDLKSFDEFYFEPVRPEEFADEDFDPEWQKEGFTYWPVALFMANTLGT